MVRPTPAACRPGRPMARLHALVVRRTVGVLKVTELNKLTASQLCYFHYARPAAIITIARSSTSSHSVVQTVAVTVPHWAGRVSESAALTSESSHRDWHRDGPIRSPHSGRGWHIALTSLRLHWHAAMSEPGNWPPVPVTRRNGPRAGRSGQRAEPAVAKKIYLRYGRLGPLSSLPSLIMRGQWAAKPKPDSPAARRSRYPGSESTRASWNVAQRLTAAADLKIELDPVSGSPRPPARATAVVVDHHDDPVTVSQRPRRGRFSVVCHDLRRNPGRPSQARDSTLRLILGVLSLGSPAGSKLCAPTCQCPVVSESVTVFALPRPGTRARDRRRRCYRDPGRCRPGSASR
jgi:hypothetical protein